MTRTGRATAAIALTAALIAALAPTAAVATTGGGTQYYVAPSGNDDNDGRSPDRPFRTLNHAAGLTDPGDVVNIMDGRYESTGYSLLQIKRSGTREAPITYRAHDDGNDVRPVLFADKDSETWHIIEVDGADHIVIEGLEVVGDNGDISLAEAQAAQGVADPEFNTNGVFINGRRSGPATHVTVRDMLVRNLPSCGICTAEADYVTIENNVVHGTSWFTRYASSGISLLENVNSDGNTGHKNFIRGNIVFDNYTQVKWERIDALSDGNGIIVDLFRNRDDSAKTYRGRTLVSDNVVHDNGGSGIHCYFSNNVDIVHNTSYRNSAALDYGSIFANNCENTRVVNNVNYVRDGRRANLDNNRDTVHSHNLWFGGREPDARGESDVRADPLFVDAAAGDFRLREGSPAIGSARPDIVPAELYGGAPNRLDRGARIGLTGTPELRPASAGPAPAPAPAAPQPVPAVEPAAAPVPDPAPPAPVTPVSSDPAEADATTVPSSQDSADDEVALSAGSSGDQLAFTGTEIAGGVAAALALVAAGVLGLILSRRRALTQAARHMG